MALRFKLDENMPDEAGALLREAGHDVRGALEQQLGGRPDERLSGACRQEDTPIAFGSTPDARLGRSSMEVSLLKAPGIILLDPRLHERLHELPLK